MTAPLFLAPHVSPVGDSVRIGSDVLLEGVEGRHAAAVRRVRVGERVDVTDGAGLRLECIVAALIGKEAVRLSVVEHVLEPQPSPRLVVVQAIPKGDRGELAVEVMTEAGVDVIVPWAATRCVAQWRGERGEKSAKRWQRTAHEAAKQAHRAWLPEVRDQASTAEVVALLSTAMLGVVLHEEATNPVTSLAVPAEGDVVVVVGPEGGVTPEELAAFTTAGAHTLRLGPTVMRTSTAGVVALGVLLSRTARWA